MRQDRKLPRERRSAIVGGLEEKMETEGSPLSAKGVSIE
jgi:hypothetical protein